MENKYELSNASKFVKSDKLCRICLTENASQTTCLHEARPDCPLESLASMVMAVARVEIHSQDGLPATICGDCLGELEAAHGFRLKCERSDELLRRLCLEELRDNKRQLASGHVAAASSVKEEATTALLELVKAECEGEGDFDNEAYDQPEDNSFFINEMLDHESPLMVKLETDDDASPSAEPRTKYKKNVKPDGPFVCDLCGKPLRTQTSLENHKHCFHSEKRKLKMGKVTGYGPNKLFHCSECPFNSRRHQALVYHIRTHTGEKPYACPQCPARFSQPGSLAAHATIHSDVMHFVCPVCGKQFKLKQKYERHKRVHSDVREHVCATCNKAFKTKENLLSHNKRHLNIRDYSCEHCGSTFVALEDLCNHSKKHLKTKDFECHLCGFRTRTKRILGEHIKRHTMERSFKCQLCSYASVERFSLKIHMRKHTREKNYACPVCGLKMIHSTSVNKHMLRAHAIHYRVNDHCDRRKVK